jgi:hypothetical protein
MKRQLLPLPLLLWSSTAFAQKNYPATDCSLAQVQAAINSETSTPADGDTITIPACPSNPPWTGTTGVTGSFTANVTIQGAGAISAAGSGGTNGTTGTDQTIFTDNLTAGRPAFVISLSIAAGKTLRITGIAFLTNSSSLNAGTAGFVTISGGTGSQLRVDHCHFHVLNSANNGTGLYIGSQLIGVADHEYMDSPVDSGPTNDFAFHNGFGWNGMSDPNGTADPSWADGDNWGTSKFFFVEDTLFNNGDVSDSHDGGRYVLRHNTIQNQNTGATGHVNQVYNHGTTDARGRAFRAAEVYDNQVLGGTFSSCGGCGAGNPFFSINSGTLLFWGNVVSQYLGAIQADHYRSYRPPQVSYPYAQTPNGWGSCGTTYPPYGPSNWDQNSVASNGYACMDQMGRGKGDLLNGLDFPNALNTVTGTIAWPHQALDPVYVWMNTYTTSASRNPKSVIFSSSNGSLSGVPGLYTEGVDYYVDDSTGGITIGTTVPGSCTTQKGFWNTSNSTLYQCQNGSFVAYYTPYTYPHPLQSGSPGPNRSTVSFAPLISIQGISACAAH